MMAYGYPATLEPDADGRLVVHFPALPEALTDGADEAEALRSSSDSLLDFGAVLLDQDKSMGGRAVE
jgi:predicted RNase H-like HicB family nuclease